MSSYYTNRNNLAEYWDRHDGHLNMEYYVNRDVIDKLIEKLNTNDALDAQ